MAGPCIRRNAGKAPINDNGTPTPILVLAQTSIPIEASAPI